MVVALALHLYGSSKGYTVDDNPFSEWLYGDWSEDKLKKFTALNSIPGVRNYMDYLLDRRSDQEYLSRYGMDYSDIHDPRKLRQTSSGARALGSAFEFVSDNVKTLYPD